MNEWFGILHLRVFIIYILRKSKATANELHLSTLAQKNLEPELGAQRTKNSFPLLVLDVFAHIAGKTTAVLF